MTNAIVTSVERVTHRYGKTFALNDLTLDIPAHCMAGLIGPDGVLWARVPQLRAPAQPPSPCRLRPLPPGRK